MILTGLTEAAGTPELLAEVSRASAGSEAKFQENLLQSLVQANPECLPIDDIEPAFKGLRSVCDELPLTWEGITIYVDNLLANEDGKLCLVECKLAANGESVRTVVAQIINYAAALAALDYDGLVDAVKKRLKSDSSNPLVDKVLGANANLDSVVAFERGVERSLERGAFLLLIVGDRIRSGLKRLAEHLQQRAGLGFSLGLIEMPMYSKDGENPPFFVQPRLVARTESVVRTVFMPGRSGPSLPDPRTETTKPATLSEIEFFDALTTKDQALVPALRRLLRRCKAEYGCDVRLLRQYNVYLDDRQGGEITVGQFSKDGAVQFWGNVKRDESLGQPVVQGYIGDVAALLPGGTAQEGKGYSNVRVDGTVNVPLKLLLDHQDSWLLTLGKLKQRLEDAASTS